MKSRYAWQGIFLFVTLIFSTATLAVTPAEETEKKCVKPKFRDFVPGHKSVVAPESDISFHINRHADPLHVKVFAKKIPMNAEVIDKQTFYFVRAKLPKELQGGYARISLEARGAEGDCVGQDGWLVKIEGGSAPDGEPEAKQEADTATSAKDSEKSE